MVSAVDFYAEIPKLNPVIMDNVAYNKRILTVVQTTQRKAQVFKYFNEKNLRSYLVLKFMRILTVKFEILAFLFFE